MTIQVKVPSNTPAGDTISIFGGQLFDAFTRPVPMSRVQGTSDTWQGTISAPAGTIVRYYFDRNSGAGREAYVPFSSSPVNFRELLMKNGATASETVAQWIDKAAVNNSTGTLTGRVTDPAGNPLPEIWVSAGPHQTMTDANGDFQIYGVPAGACTVTVRSEDGEFGAVNVTSTISPNGTTVQNVVLVAAAMSPVIFRVTVPADTPAGAIPRLFGDIYRLGMMQNAGELEPDTTRLIEMTPAGGSQWTYTVQLGNGTCVNYLYTLGYRLLNFETDNQSRNITRALCVNGPTAVSDTVTSWKSPIQAAVSLTVTSPTGTEDTLYVTTDGYGGRVPMKMWPIGSGKATYTLYLNRNTTLNYRYIRNGDPDQGLEIVGTDTNPPAYRSIAVGPGGASSNDTIVAWRHQMRETALTTVTSGMAGPIASRSTPFQTGVETIDYWRSNWMPLVAPTMARIKNMNAQWVQIPAVWSFVITDPPKGEPAHLVSFQPQDLLAHIRAAKAAGLHVALFSLAYPHNFTGVHSNAWFDQLFQQVQSFSLYYAKIAQQEGAEMLMLTTLQFDADNDRDPATRIYINARWKSVIAAIRASGYTGSLTTDSLVSQRTEYDWYGDLDYLGDRPLLPVASSDSATVQSMYDRVITALNSQYLPIVNRFHKPLLFTEVGFYSAKSSALQTYDIFAPQISPFLPADPSVPSDYDEQARAYQAVLLAFAATPWVQGAYSFGYEYFNLDSKGYSIRGKTAEQIASQIYQQINAPPAPPTALVATSSGTSVTLTWTAPTGGTALSTYIVEAGSSPGATDLASFSTGTTATTFSATGIRAGTYYVRVRAANAAGSSPPSAEAILVVGGASCTAAPAAPGNLTVVSISGGTVVLAWNAASGGSTSYIVEAGSGPGATNLANSDLGSAATSLTATSVGRGTYYVRIRGQNLCGVGAASNELIVEVP